MGNLRAGQGPSSTLAAVPPLAAPVTRSPFEAAALKRPAPSPYASPLQPAFRNGELISPRRQNPVMQLQTSVFPKSPRVSQPTTYSSPAAAVLISPRGAGPNESVKGTMLNQRPPMWRKPSRVSRQSAEL